MSKSSKNDTHQQHSLLNRAEEAYKLLKKHLEIRPCGENNLPQRC
jgi:hypothetical protein